MKEPKERLNKADLAATRESVDDGNFDAVHWCTGKKLLADPPTEHDPSTAALPLKALSTDQHSRPAEKKINFAQPCREDTSPSLLILFQYLQQGEGWRKTLSSFYALLCCIIYTW